MDPFHQLKEFVGLDPAGIYTICGPPAFREQWRIQGIQVSTAQFGASVLTYRLRWHKGLTVAILSPFHVVAANNHSLRHPKGGTLADTDEMLEIEILSAIPAVPAAMKVVTYFGIDKLEETRRL